MEVERNVRKKYSSFTTTDNSFTSKRNAKYSIAIVKFNGNCLNQDNLSFIHGNIVKFI